ncbi:BTAD domain-containing putative transcriptional regulator [Jiangella anatolica]|uniref:AfsR family transcriptional regulator n=1 Tax=Jiangella anatolica TaxID=2670374 RepID=A0A2W2C2H0_9ACTN|nr:BTAD domain-containing putative transcriptional regulator [Jiangella anatolica]PZF82389.1 AfsR family transcriptional regulator [Jiangella anatolica]
MRIGILGPLEVRAGDGSPVYVAGARLRALLIILALEPGRLVPAGRLVDGIWGDDPPAGAANALQALVSRLRRALPELAIESHPAGYRLALDPDAVDAARFERAVTAARSAPDDAAVEDGLRAALALWRGPALLDVAESEFFHAARTRLEDLRLAATEDRVDAALRLGRGAALTTELTTLVAEYPLRERLAGQLLRALVAAGRPAEALAAYERTRAALADELGTDPSAELAALHTSILRGELPAAEPVAAPAAALPPTPPRTNLRAGLTSFVGRDADVARVHDLVGEYRLTTLTGPGGSGKTRLAGEASRALLDRMPDGVWLVELAPVTAGADLAAAVLGALDLRDQLFLSSGDDAIGRLVSVLRTREALLVLDNCEHVIDAAAALADRLLGDCPRLRILATSREPLGITGEAVWPVEPLALPEHDDDPAGLLGSDAVRLLVDRARAVRPGFTVTAADAPAVARICRALDGMPLAIELAAARLRTMTVDQLAARLDDRFRLLTGGSRTALPRHQTLRAVVDWSWEPLPEPERVVLRRLAVFAHGATAEAAARVCGDGADVLDRLSSLSDRSLLLVDDHGDVPRYRMLETIKAYALERLDDAGERETVRRAHLDYVTDLAEWAEPHLRRAEQLEWLRRLAAVHDDLNAAVRGAVAAGDAPGALRLATAAMWYWWLSGHRAEAGELTAEALTAPGDVDDVTRATAYAGLAMIATAGLGDEQEVKDWVEEAERLCGGNRSNALLRMVGGLADFMRYGDDLFAASMAKLLDDEDPWIRALGRLNHARLLPFAERREPSELALAEFRSTGERWGISFGLTTLADLLARQGDLAAALAHYEEAIVAASEVGTTEDVVFMRGKEAQLRWLLGDTAGSAAALDRAERDAAGLAWPDAVAGLALYKGDLARWAGDLDTARTELDRADALLATISVHPLFRAMVHDSRGHLAAAAGDLAEAAAERAAATRLALDIGDEDVLGRTLVGLADHALRRDRPADAARLLAAVTVLAGGPDRSQAEATRAEEAVRAALGEEAAAELTAVAARELDAVDATAAVSLVRETAASVLGQTISGPAAGGTA